MQINFIEIIQKMYILSIVMVTNFLNTKQNEQKSRKTTPRMERLPA